MGTAAWIKKNAEKIWEEAPRKAFWALLPLGIASLWPAFRRWLFSPVEVFGVTTLAFGIVTAGLGVLVWSQHRRLRALETTPPEVKVTLDPKPAPRYEPAIVRDDKVAIEWHIAKDPDDWIKDLKLEQHSPEYWAEIVAGPFHSECKASFSAYYHEEGEGQYLDGLCSHCERVVFYWRAETGWDDDGDRVVVHRSLSKTLLAVLKELQRIHRKDGYLSTKVVLTKPEYWDWIEPAKD